LTLESRAHRSEEVFDYSAADMTQDKMRDMKQSLAREIGLVFELCFFVMQNSQVWLKVGSH
jgi:exportin-1